MPKKKMKKLRLRERENSAGVTLRAVRADDAHGADPVGRDLGHQRVQHLQAGGVHHKDFWVMAITQQTALPLRPDGELVELQRKRRGSLIGQRCREGRDLCVERKLQP